MKKHIRLIVIVTVAALIIGLLLWRFWPHPFSSIMPLEEENISFFDVIATIQQIENATPVTYSYKYHTSFTDDFYKTEEMQDIMEILATSDYRQDLRNLLPWGRSIVEGDGTYDGRTIYLQFLARKETGNSIAVHFVSESFVAVQVGNDPFRIYHPTNPNTFDRLIEYMETHFPKQ